jgi:uncharacterized damage-inducible protein DinB
MATASSQQLSEIAVLRYQNQLTQQVLHMNLADVSHAESLVRPKEHGNSLNWIVGHLLCVYNNVLPGLGQAPVMLTERLKRYDRGSDPIRDAEALDFAALHASLDEAITRFDAGLAGLSAEALDAKSPFSPTNNPEETIRSLMGTVLFHQAYHAGQTGVLRRVIGKPGAIR